MKIQQQPIVLQQQQQQQPETLKEQHQPQSRPVVRFAADVTVHSVMSFQDYTASELKSCFYSKTDYKKFKHSSLITLKLNREGDLPSDHTMRGLECRTREGAALKKEAKRQAFRAMIQCHAESSSLEELAQALHQVTAKQQHSASVRGMCDEMEVREYQNSSSSSKSSSKHQQSNISQPSITTALQLQSILDTAPELTTIAGPAA